MKKRIKIIVESKFLKRMSVIFVVLSVVILALGTSDRMPNSIILMLYIIKISLGIFFTFEYISRAWTYGRKYIFSISGLIDLIAVFPSFLNFFLKENSKFLDILKALRVLTLHRVEIIFKDLKQAVKNKKEELTSSITAISILMILSSVFMYAVEHDSQPEDFKSAFSGLWWVLCTITTIGYGDLKPVTNQGKTLGAIIILLGICLVNIMLDIVARGFSEVIKQKHAQEINYCPHCNKKL